MTAHHGQAVDANGMPARDPTENVLDLVHAANRRQDDLRTAESSHLREMSKMRADHATEMRLAESLRLDAIRAVDVQAVQQAAAVSATQATTLATQVGVSAEAMRVQVAATATASAIALGAALDPIQKDVAELRKVQYEQAGQKAQITETKTETQVSKNNTGMWIGIAIAVIALLCSVVLGVTGVVITLILSGG
jgi:hypothetical protein